MKMPWHDKTGLAKAVAFFATLTLVSLGLCGVNFVSILSFGALGGGRMDSGWRTVMTSILFVAAWLEVAGIAVGIVGLVATGIIAAFNAVSGRNDETKGS